jgi:hypothetical protein
LATDDQEDVMSTNHRRDVVGVFHDREEAEAAADKARALGVPDEEIHVDRHEDKVASLRGEMRDELEKGWFSPQGGLLLTKRMVKGILAVSPFAIAAGVLLALPFAFIVSWGELPLWGRLIATTLIGATAGGTFGFIVGGGEAEKGAAAPLAAEHGVTVRVGDPGPEVQQALVEEEPMRLDVVTPSGTPLGPITNEAEHNDEGVVEDLQRAWDEPDRDLHNRHEDLVNREERESASE